MAATIFINYHFPFTNWRIWSAKSLTNRGLGVLHKSLALVGATCSLIYNLFIFYVTCLISVQLFAYLCPPLTRITRPLKDENTITIEKMDVKERASEQVTTATFMDMEPGVTETQPEYHDPLREQVYTTQTEIQNFLSRPIKLATETWNVGSPLRLTFIDPWGDFIRNARVKEKVAHFKLMNFDMNIKVVINGTPFHYGRALVYYTPLPMYDDVNDYAFTGLTNDLFTLNTQKPHFFINPTECQGGEMVLPFFYPKANIDIVSNDITNGVGLLQIDSINDLKHANGASDPITITVYGWASNVKLGVATQRTYDNVDINPGLVQERADEYGMGPISKPATALASIAERLKDAPILGPYATATQIGANALAKVASIFGYSRTPILTTSVYRPNTKGSFATSNQEDDVAKLSLDCKQELSIDPRIFGRDGQDELDILSIATRQSYLATFPWRVNASEETLLWNAYVTPSIHRSGNSETSGHIPHYYTALSFACLPFEYWRGSMLYRFQVVCSKYHRGRLRFVWDPVGLDNSLTESPDYNTAQQIIVDISETTDFVIKIGWGADTSFLEMDSVFSPSQSYFGTGPLRYTTSSHVEGTRLPDMNGILRVYVVNELSVPGEVNNDIEINAYVSAGDDFELAVPTSDKLSRLLLMSPERVQQPQNTNPFSALRREDVLERADDSNPTEMASTLEQPNNTTPDATVGTAINTADKTPLIHYGEVFRSFRSLLKRYSTHEKIRFGLEDNEESYNLISRPSFPYFPSFTYKVDDPPNEFSPVIQAPDNDGWDEQYRVFTSPTLMGYLGTAFVGWRGSTRWYIDVSNKEALLDSITVSRDSFNTVYNAVLSAGGYPGITTYGFYEYMYDIIAQLPGFDGVTVQIPDINPSVTFDVPFYSRFRFAPSRWLQNFSAGDTVTPNYGIWRRDPCFWMPSWVLKVLYFPSSGAAQAFGQPASATSMVSAGDDFNFVFYIGPPPLYEDISAPVNPAVDSPMARLKRMKNKESVTEI